MPAVLFADPNDNTPRKGPLDDPQENPDGFCDATDDHPETVSKTEEDIPEGETPEAPKVLEEKPKPKKNTLGGGIKWEDLQRVPRWNIHTLKTTGLAVAVGEENNFQRLSRSPQGLLLLGEEVVAYQHPVTRTVMPAIQLHNPDGREAFNTQVAEALSKVGVHIFQDTFHALVTRNDHDHPGPMCYDFIPLPNSKTLDSFIVSSMVFWKQSFRKEGEVSIPVLQLVEPPERTTQQIFSAPSIRRQLPQVEKVADVSLPYFITPYPSIRPKLFWTKPGYNPEARVINLDKLRTTNHPKAVTDRWFYRLIKDYEFEDRDIDIPAAISLMLSGYCSEMFYSFNPDGTRSEKHTIPISLVQSNAPASGKTTMMKLMALPAFGFIRETITRRPEEVEKIMTAHVLDGRGYVFFDEVNKAQSDALLVAATGFFNGRVLSKSQMADSAVGAAKDLQLMLSGVFPEFNTMMARRILGVKMMTTQTPGTKKLSRYLERGTIGRLRPFLLTFAKNIVEHWAKSGFPQGMGDPDWNEYARIVGGILKASNLEQPFERRSGYNLLDDDAKDRQLELYVEELKKGTHHWPTEDEMTVKLATDRRDSVFWDRPIPLPRLLGGMQKAGYFDWFSSEDKYSLRNFKRALKPWDNLPRPIIKGIWLRSKKTAKGVMVWLSQEDPKKIS
jgi:hypothetical protein